MGNTINKYLIVDTNILQFAGSKPQERSKKIVDLILSKEKQNLKRAISVASIYEAVQNRNAVQEDKIFETLSLYTQLEANKGVFLLAGWLSDLYRGDGIPDSQISMCDRLIASTALLTGSTIMTTDGRDFPRPFFNELETTSISYQDKNKKECNVKIFFLEADFRVIDDRFIKRQKG